MSLKATGTTLAIAVALTIAPLAAQGRGKGPGASKPPKPPVSTPANGSKPPAAKPGGGPPPNHGSEGNPHAPEASPSAPPSANSAVTHLHQQPQLASKLSTLLPPGTNLDAAAAGFKNLGQFVAAVHVSHNLGIPFDQLRARMVGANAVPLGQAIQALRPATTTTTVNREVKRAEDEAREDLKKKS